MNCYKLFLCICASSILVSCHKDTDVVELTSGYLGTLTLEYSRTFPSFSNIVTIDIDINKTGEVTIDLSDVVPYDAVDEVTGTAKLREEGSIAVSTLSGKVSFTNDGEYVIINARTFIIGAITIWGWDDNMGWIFPQTVPIEVFDPVISPLNFSIDESTLSGDEIGAIVPGYMGNMTFKWTLLLVPKLTD